MKNFLTMMVIILAGVVSSSSAWGSSLLPSTTGDIHITSLAGPLVPGGQEDQFQTSLMLEQSGLSLGSDLAVDASVAGTYDATSPLTPGIIAAGTVVSDWYFHSDPVLTSGTRFAGTITFTDSILGVISRSGTLTATDGQLDQPGVVYGGYRGFELTPTQDQFSISSDLHTLTFSVMTWASADDLRILTGALSPVSAFSGPSFQGAATPEPATFLILGFGLIGISVVRKTRKAR